MRFHLRLTYLFNAFLEYMMKYGVEINWVSYVHLYILIKAVQLARHIFKVLSLAEHRRNMTETKHKNHLSNQRWSDCVRDLSKDSQLIVDFPASNLRMETENYAKQYEQSARSRCERKKSKHDFRIGI